MWADNEADLDLLGFDFLVDGLVVALTEPRLLPLTIGVLGDWGSGKSSLMRIAAQELAALRPQGEDDQAADGDGRDAEPASPYLTINFSPWQYEDHDDVKIALMTAVLDTIAVRAPESAEQVTKLRGSLLGCVGGDVGSAALRLLRRQQSCRYSSRARCRTWTPALCKLRLP